MHILPRASSSLLVLSPGLCEGDGAREKQREKGSGQQTGQPSEGLLRISIAILVSPSPEPC